MVAPFIGHGTTIDFATSGLSLTLLEAGVRMSRGSADMSDMETDGFKPMQPHPNAEWEISGRANFDPDEDPDGTPDSAINGDLEAITLTFPLVGGGLTPASWSGQGALIEYEATIPNEERAEVSFTIVMSGELTVAAQT